MITTNSKIGTNTNNTSTQGSSSFSLQLFHYTYYWNWTQLPNPNFTVSKTVATTRKNAGKTTKPGAGESAYN